MSLNHVEAAVAGSFTQADHGKNTRLRQLRLGDGMIFYSPRTELRGGQPLQQFTALATIIGDNPYRVTISDDFQPWRLEVEFHPSRCVDAKPLVDQLSFITDPSHWGLPFRRGLFAIAEKDFENIAREMQHESNTVAQER